MTDEQRGKRAFCLETRRAADLFPGACVSSALTAPFSGCAGFAALAAAKISCRRTRLNISTGCQRRTPGLLLQRRGQNQSQWFAWNSPRSWLWRKRLAQLAQKAGFTTPQDFKAAHGSHWAWTLQKKILSEPLTQYPTSAIAQADGHHDLPNDLIDIQITSSPKNLDYWEDHLDEMIATINKDLSLARLKHARQPSPQIPEPNVIFPALAHWPPHGD